MRSVTDTEVVRKLFDDLAGDYDQHVPFFAAFGRRLADWCGLRPGQRVLDVAAGRGAVTAPAALAVGTRGAVLAIDNAPGMLLALAADHRKVPQLATCVMDAHRLGVRDARFDVVTCGFAFHFLDNPRQAMTEAHRVLRPGGLLAFSQPAADRPLSGDREPGRAHDDRWDFYRELIRDMAGRADEAKSPDPFTPPSRPLPETCTEAGFTAIEQHTAWASFAIRDPMPLSRQWPAWRGDGPPRRHPAGRPCPPPPLPPLPRRLPPCARPAGEDDGSLGLP
jgi:ubiquinone/menaquinone biosynthesis C-methylase UbiE